MAVSAYFLSASAKTLLLQERLDTRLCLHVVLGFRNISLRPKTQIISHFIFHISQVLSHMAILEPTCR